jgi:hypothetical protein
LTLGTPAEHQSQKNRKPDNQIVLGKFNERASTG